MLDVVLNYIIGAQYGLTSLIGGISKTMLGGDIFSGDDIGLLAKKIFNLISLIIGFGIIWYFFFKKEGSGKKGLIGRFVAEMSSEGTSDKSLAFDVLLVIIGLAASWTPILGTLGTFIGRFIGK